MKKNKRQGYKDIKKKFPISLYTIWEEYDIKIAPNQNYLQWVDEVVSSFKLKLDTDYNIYSTYLDKNSRFFINDITKEKILKKYI